MFDWLGDLMYDNTLLWLLIGVVVICLLIGLVSLAVWGAALPFDRMVCKNTGNAMGVPWEWHSIGGCFLELDGQMLPKDKWFYIRYGVTE